MELDSEGDAEWAKGRASTERLTVEDCWCTLNAPVLLPELSRPGAAVFAENMDMLESRLLRPLMTLKPVLRLLGAYR